jgi:hypothetical protein
MSLFPLALFLNLIQRPRARIHSARAHLVDHSYVQIAAHVNLTGQARVWRQLSFNSQPAPFKFLHFSWFTCQYFDPTRSTTSIATATVQYVDARILYCEHELFPLRRLGLDETRSSFRLNFGH